MQLRRENTTKCRPCPVIDAFDSNGCCSNCVLWIFQSILASVSDRELLQISLESSQFQIVGMSHAVFAAPNVISWLWISRVALFTQSDLASVETSHSIKIPVVEWQRLLLSHRLISGPAHTAANALHVLGSISLRSSAGPGCVMASMSSMGNWICKGWRSGLYIIVAPATAMHFSCHIRRRHHSNIPQGRA